MANLEDFLSVSLTLFKNRVVRGLVDFGHVCLLVIDVFFGGVFKNAPFRPSLWRGAHRAFRPIGRDCCLKRSAAGKEKTTKRTAGNSLAFKILAKSVRIR